MVAAPVQTTPSPEIVYQQTARTLLQDALPVQPDWLQALKLQALSRFETLGFPTRRLEAWKYINVRPLLTMPLKNDAVEPKVCPPALQRHLLEIDGDNAVIRLVFINGRFNEERSTQNRLPEGAFIGSFKTALQERPEKVRNHLASYIHEEPDAFSALNTALFEDGVFIDLPENTQLEPLVQLVYVNFGEDRRATYPRNLVVLGKQAKMTMVVEHLGLSQAVCFNNSVNEFILGEGAKADCTVVLSEGPQCYHLAATRGILQTNAKLAVNTITLSGSVNRHTVRALLQGEKAKVHLNGLDVLDQKTEVYHHTVVEHWVPNATSDQLYKSILDDASKSEFNSLVFVAKDADGTDSHQLNKTLLLSEDARVWTRPQLQINADDVKCAHGAAVGQLDEDQLFYLASRGLSKDLAQSLLTYGFAEDVIHRIPHPQVRKYLDGRVLSNLHNTDATLKKELANNS